MGLIILALVTLIGVAVVAGVLMAVVGRGREVGEGATVEFPYERAEALFTPAERSFLGVLDQVVEGEFRIFGKVRLADIVGVRAMADRSAWQTAFNKIDRKHVDFVGCDPGDLSVKFVVELDDRSHEREDRRERDAFVDGALKAAGIPVFHIPARRGYTFDDVRSALFVSSPN
jgi:hypothetical protein